MSTAELFLPLLFKVQHASFNSGALNDLGNTTESWSAPVEKLVYGWGPPESTTSLTMPQDVIFDSQRYTVDLTLLVPPGWQSKHRDRFQLHALDPEGEWYRQIGPTGMYDANPFGWNPGGVVMLVSVTGTGGET
jgi:hypothetical protein